ncbi:unnamed protein product, partial [Ixodes persulcatus]
MRWRNLRDTFGKKLRKMKKRSCSGAAEPTLKWAYFYQMLFLWDSMEPRVTTSNIKLDVENENSVQEVLQGYEEELEDSASQLLSANVDGRGDERPAHSAPSTPTHSPHVPPTLPSHPICLSSPSSSCLCSMPILSFSSVRSPSGPFVESATQRLARTFPAPAPISRRIPRQRPRSARERQPDLHKLQKKETLSQQFLLSLSSHLDNVPQYLYGYCPIHLLDVVLQYQRGVIPTTLM